MIILLFFKKRCKDSGFLPQFQVVVTHFLSKMSYKGLKECFLLLLFC